MAKKPVKRIHLNTPSGVVEYTYVIGRGGNIVIRTPERKSILTDMSQVSGWNWDDIERGIRKKYFSITPSMVKWWLVLYLDPTGAGI